jgi:hypothetical protein
MYNKADQVLVFAMLGFLALISSNIALAQGTPEQHQACSGDAQRLCPHTIPDVERTKACMIAKRRALSPACRAAFARGR